MSDLIDRQAVLKHIEKIRQKVQMMDDTHRANITMNGMYLCEKAVRNQPSAEPKKGKWVFKRLYKEADECICSECGQLMTTAHGKRMRFCPNCGTKMEVIE